MNTIAVTETTQYYLQDSRGLIGDNLALWSRAGGYTTNIEEAELFDEKRAFSQNRSRESDVPWPAEYLKARTHRVVDMQYVRPLEARDLGRVDAYYLQDIHRHYIGNDMQFLSTDGKTFTTDLDKAKVLSFDEAFGELPPGSGIPWPKPYIDSKSRLAAKHNLANLKEALQEKAKMLNVPPKPKREIYRCEGCGVFMSIGDYYSCSGCSRCGTDNRP